MVIEESFIPHIKETSFTEIMETYHGDQGVFSIKDEGVFYH